MFCRRMHSNTGVIMELYIPDKEFALIEIGDKKIAILGPNMELSPSTKAISLDVLLVTEEHIRNSPDLIGGFMSTGTQIVKY